MPDELPVKELVQELLRRDRTRFLAPLQQMIQQDRRGAVMDMLQILREVGAVQCANSTREVNSSYLKDSEHRESLERDVAHMLVSFLTDQQVIQFTVTPVPTDGPRSLSTLRAEIFVVTKEYLHIKGDPKEPSNAKA